MQNKNVDKDRDLIANKRPKGWLEWPAHTARAVEVSRMTDRLTDRLTDTARIGNNSLHLIHSMQPKK